MGFGYDNEFADVIRRSQKPVFVVANKADTPEKSQLASEFYALGMGEVYPVSSENGGGTGEILDELIKIFPTEGIENPDAGIRSCYSRTAKRRKVVVSLTCCLAKREASLPTRQVPRGMHFIAGINVRK